MAFRSGSSGSHVGAEAFSVTAPAGIVSGDIILALAIDDTNTSTITPPTGFSTLQSATTSGLDSQTYKWCWKVAGSSEPSSYTWQGSAGHVQVVMGAWSGRNTSVTPTIGSISSNSAGSSSPVTLAVTGLTASAGDDLAIFVGLDQGVQTDTWSFSAPASFSNGQTCSPGDWGSDYFAYEDNVSAGATGTQNVTATITSGTGQTAWAGLMISMQQLPLLPTINTQPVQQTTSTGGSATFSVSATASGGTLSYAWETAPAIDVNGNVPGTWTSAGTNSSSLTLSSLAASDHGKFVRVTVTDANGSVKSAYVRLFLNDQSMTGMGQLHGPGFIGWSSQYFNSRAGKSSHYMFTRQNIYDGDSNTTESVVWTDWFYPAAAVVSQAEAGAATDATSTTLTAVSSSVEALSGADSTSNALTTAGAASESLASTDTSSNVVTTSGSSSEAGSGADTQSSALTTTGSISESLASSDSLSGIQASTNSTLEALASADSSDATQTSSSIVAETLSSAETSDAAQTSLNNTTEALAGIDASSNSLASSSSSIEALSSTESSDASQASLNNVAEAISASDSLTSIQTSTTSTGEALSTVEATDSTSATNSAGLDSLSGIDSSSSGQITADSTLESVSSGDLTTASQNAVSNVTESSASSDSTDTVLSTLSSTVEAANAVDVSSGVVLGGSLGSSEFLAAADSSSVTVTFVSTSSEAISAADQTSLYQPNIDANVPGQTLTASGSSSGGVASSSSSVSGTTQTVAVALSVGAAVGQRNVTIPGIILVSTASLHAGELHEEASPGGPTFGYDSQHHPREPRPEEKLDEYLYFTILFNDRKISSTHKISTNVQKIKSIKVLKAKAELKEAKVEVTLKSKPILEAKVAVTIR